MKKSTRKILLGTGVVAAAAGAVAAASSTVMKKLVGIAMDRPEPEIMKKKHKLTGSKADVHAYEDLKTAEQALASSEHELVEIESHDGLKLVGHWFGCENPKRVIVAMHGWRSGWARDFGVIAPFWRENDCAVLYPEQRSQGASEGEYMSLGLLERHDCVRWANWVHERMGSELPMYLAGVSMGATTVLMTAADELPENVRGIVADCGFVSPHTIWRHVVGNNLHIPYSGFRAAVADKQCRNRIHMGTQEYSTVEALKNSKVPVMLIHGEDDTFVPVTETRKNYEACTSDKHLFIVPGAGHGMSYVVDKAGYEQQVLHFWELYDHPAAPVAEEEPEADPADDAQQ